MNHGLELLILLVEMIDTQVNVWTIEAVHKNLPDGADRHAVRSRPVPHVKRSQSWRGRPDARAVGALERLSSFGNPLRRIYDNRFFLEILRIDGIDLVLL